MKHIGFLMLFVMAAMAGHAQLIINELSQGPSGNKEYVELLVTGTPTCGGANTVDLRGWIIDDNNSWHASGSGSGIAGGHIRFDSISQWANVKIGSLILIYNDADVSPAVSALTPDVNDANGDCVYIVPVSSAVLQKNTTLPGNNGTMTTYAVPGTVYSGTGTWSGLGMANGGDAFHTVSPANYTVAYHAIGYGKNSANTPINTDVEVYYSVDQGGKVIYMTNAVSNNPFDAANYIDTTASDSETPGQPNNTANAEWIHSMNNNCQAFVLPTITFNNPGQITCANSSVIIRATSSGSVYNWSNGVTTANDTVSAAGTYYLTVSDAGNVCTATDSITITSTASLAITTSATDASCGANNGTATVTVTNGTATSYAWSNTGSNATISNLAPGNYDVTVTGAGGCSATATVVVASSGSLAVSTSATNTTCGAPNGTATVTVTTGTATAYNWSNSGTTATISNLAPGTYTVTVTGGNCSATASVVVSASNSATVTITTDKTIFCVGDSANVCAPSGSASYLWNTGATSACIAVKAAGNYYVTVTENGGCTATSNHLSINVYPQPPVSISVNGDTLRAYGSVTYQWYLDNNIIPGANAGLYIAQQPGSYQVLISDTNGCTARSNAVVVVRTGIETIKDENFTIYPNPLNGGYWKINAGSDLIGNMVRIYDNEGRIVYKQEINSQYMEIEADLARGIYMLRLNASQGVITKKLVRL